MHESFRVTRKYIPYFQFIFFNREGLGECANEGEVVRGGTFNKVMKHFTKVSSWCVLGRMGECAEYGKSIRSDETNSRVTESVSWSLKTFLLAGKGIYTVELLNICLACEIKYQLTRILVDDTS